MSTTVSSKNRIRWKINGLDFNLHEQYDSFYLENVSRIRAFILSNQFKDDYGRAEDLAQDVCIRIWSSLYNPDGLIRHELILERVAEQEEKGYTIDEREAFNHLVKNIIWSSNSNLRVKEDRRIDLEYVGGGNEDMDDESVEVLYSVIQNIACHDSSFEKVRISQFYEDLRDSLGNEKSAQVWELITLGYTADDIADLLNLDAYHLFSIIQNGKIQYNDILSTHFSLSEMNISQS